MSIRPIAMRDAFLERICQAMLTDDKIFFVTADFGSPVLDKIREQFPTRFVNVGIAEQNLINISAGLAIEGFKVFAYAIAPFITMRCYEQIRVNLALLSVVRPINVTLIGVGAGYSYVVSGPTHQCYEDLTLMRALPNVAVYSPADHITTAQLFDLCLRSNGTKYLRLDAQVLSIIYDTSPPDLACGFNVLADGNDVCLIATGYMVHTALKINHHLKSLNLSVGIIDLFNISTFAAELLEEKLSSYTKIVTMEEGFRGKGGLDSMMFEWITRRGMKQPILNIGVDPAYHFELGTRDELHEQVGIGVDIATSRILEFMEQKIAKVF